MNNQNQQGGTNQQQPGQRQWEQVSGKQRDVQRWEPHKAGIPDPNNPPFIHGYFTDLLEYPGRNGPFNVVEITTVNPDGSLGMKFDISGGKMMEEEFDKIRIGTYVGIKYKGKVTAKQGGNTYNYWDIFQDSKAVPYHSLPGAIVKREKAVQAPAQNQGQQNFNQGQGQNFNQGQFQQNQGFQQPAQNQGFQQPGTFQQPGNNGLAPFTPPATFQQNGGQGQFQQPAQNGQQFNQGQQNFNQGQGQNFNTGTSNGGFAGNNTNTAAPQNQGQPFVASAQQPNPQQNQFSGQPFQQGGQNPVQNTGGQGQNFNAGQGQGQQNQNPALSEWANNAANDNDNLPF